MFNKVYITNKNSGDRLKEYDIKKVFSEKKQPDIKVKIDKKEKFQTILGFGGALTEASLHVIGKLDEEKRETVLKNYFDKEEGIGYNFARVHINSSDFSLGNYTYVDENDETLESFSLEREEEKLIPTIKYINSISKDKINILASPWSPPAYMKTNNEMNNGGSLKEEYENLWAKYYVKYIEEMKKKGIDIWGVTVQNEPAAKQVWDSCLYTAEEERDFVKNHLGPEFEKNNLLDKKIIIWDHNRDLVLDRATTVLEDEVANKYVWGTGIHWYVSAEFVNTTKLHNKFSDKHIIFTEGCQEGGVHLGKWHTGERYGRNIIGDLNNYIEAWIDWNVALNEEGGPNHVGNLCDAPIIVDTKNNDIIYNSSFYYIAHFSKFIKKNSRRVLSQVENANGVYSLATVDENDDLTIVIMNENKEDKAIKLVIDDKEMNIELYGNSIYTFTKEDK